MGTKLHFRMGSFYRVDDRTGFPERAEDTRREWQGYFVSKRVWEVRQPQDFVRGVNDIQTVPFPRPRQTNIFVGPAVSQFEVYGDNPLGPSFDVLSGSIMVNRGIGIVNAANFPSGF